MAPGSPSLTSLGVPASASSSCGAWESRHGFPRPERLPTGHRRYRAADLAAIGRVVRDRDAGLSLEAAVRRAAEPPAGPTGSVFAELRRGRPDLPVHRLSRRTMLAVSRAIEDEAAAAEGRPMLAAGFQTERRPARPTRWRERWLTSAATLVFADFCASGGAPARRVPTRLRCPWMPRCGAVVRRLRRRRVHRGPRRLGLPRRRGPRRSLVRGHLDRGSARSCHRHRSAPAHLRRSRPRPP